jgi:nicotinate-nucleotide adenylyltransferase
VSEFRRLGVFGGSFDPPHMAHVALVRSALEHLHLDEVLVVPTGQAWHKSRQLTQACHRAAMTRLAFEGLDRVKVDERELLREGPSYTIDTLVELQAEHPDARLYLLIGDDQRRTLPSWHRVQDVARIAIICAAQRDPLVGAWNDLQPAGNLGATFRANVQTLPMAPLPISATAVRDHLAHRQSIAGMVPTAVERYIHEHHLYGLAP